MSNPIEIYIVKKSNVPGKLLEGQIDLRYKQSRISQGAAQTANESANLLFSPISPNENEENWSRNAYPKFYYVDPPLKNNNNKSR